MFLEQKKLLDAHYYAIFESVDDAIMIADAEGNYVDANPAASRLLGYSHDEFLQLRTFDIVAEGRTTAEQEHSSMLKHGYWRGEIELKRKDGVIITVEGNASRVGIGENAVYVSISRDLTSRKLAQDELRKNQEQLQAIINNSSAIIFVKDLEGHYLLVNQQFEKLYPYEGDSFIGKTAYDHSPKYAEQWQKNEKEVFENGVTIEFEEVGNFGGEDRIYLSIKSPLFDPTGKVYAVCGILTDITERKKAEQALRELDNLKDLFISVASHELRSPLTIIQGFSQLVQRNLQKELKLLETDPNPDAIRIMVDRNLRSISNVLQQTENMDNLVSQLLDFSRLQSQQLQLNLSENTSLVNMVLQVVEHQQLINPNNLINLVNNANEDLLTGTFDKQRLEQVLINLISNAIKYSPPSYPVVVGIDTKIEDNRKVGLVWIKDQGYGISEEDQKHVFDRFYRVKDESHNKVEGLGLGLYISYEFIQKHGGKMWVESKPGTGSTFYFTLPL